MSQIEKAELNPIEKTVVKAVKKAELRAKIEPLPPDSRIWKSRNLVAEKILKVADSY